MEELLESGLPEHVSHPSAVELLRAGTVFLISTPHSQAFQVSQIVKNLSAMQETWVQSLSQEDPLEKGMATHSSILAGRIPWTEEFCRLYPMGSQRVRHD